MLVKRSRLIKKKDFQNVFRAGHARDGTIFFLKLVKNNLNVSRFGFVVSQKVSKKATARNKIKRRFRTIIRLMIKQIKPGFDVVIIAQPSIIKNTYQEIREMMQKLFKKNHLLNE